MAATAKECVAASSHKPPQVFVIDREGADQGDLDYILGLQLYQKFGLVLVAGGHHDTAGFERVVLYRKAGFDLAKAVLSAAGTPQPRKRTHNSPDPDNPRDLSPRESEIAGMLAQGFSNRRIAEEIGLKVVTVKNFVALIMRKLGCSNRVQVALRLAELKRGQDGDGKLG